MHSYISFDLTLDVCWIAIGIFRVLVLCLTFECVVFSLSVMGFACYGYV